MQLITLFRFIEVLVDAPYGATLKFCTDLPGDVMTMRASAAIPGTRGRHPYRLSLSGSCKGKLYQVSIVPSGAVRIYAAKIYARVLGPAATAWGWYTVPVPPTSSEWQPISLPIPVTPEDWQRVSLPIPPTAESWNAVKLPIPMTPDDWQGTKLPVPATAEDWDRMLMPIKPTPVVPEWVQVQVDA